MVDVLGPAGEIRKAIGLLCTEVNADRKKELRERIRRLVDEMIVAVYTNHHVAREEAIELMNSHPRHFTELQYERLNDYFGDFFSLRDPSRNQSGNKLWDLWSSLRKKTA